MPFGHHERQGIPTGAQQSSHGSSSGYSTYYSLAALRHVQRRHPHASTRASSTDNICVCFATHMRSTSLSSPRPASWAR